MSLKYSDLLDIMEQRAERLGLIDVDEGRADSVELMLYVFQALLEIVESADIPAYMTYDALIAQTTTGKADYNLPDEFGRLILPRVHNKRGFYLFDTVNNVQLEYMEPPSFFARTEMSNNVPIFFTVAEEKMWLSPPPNGVYTIRATYIKQITRPELDDTVTLQYPTALIETALQRFATDVGKQAQGLTTSKQESLVRLTQGSR
jgi:hypothetical protein